MNLTFDADHKSDAINVYDMDPFVKYSDELYTLK